MTREQKQIWVEALRSGDFKQTKRRLYNTKNNAYCCLGVACKVLGREITPEDDDKMPKRDSSYEWLTDVLKVDRDFRYELSEANDEEGLTFAEIADKIEKELRTED